MNEVTTDHTPHTGERLNAPAAPASVAQERATPEEILRARQRYAEGSDDNIEVDDNARVSRGDGGVWVQAWVWLVKPDDGSSS